MSVSIGAVNFSTHAHRKWQQRANDGKGPECSLEQAWQEGFDVEIPAVDGKPRLHPPSKTLLVHHPDTYTHHDRVVKTVLNAYPENLQDFCEICHGCGDYIKPGMYKHCCRDCQKEYHL